MIADRTVKCHECDGYVYAGQALLIDKIPYGGLGRVRFHSHLLHPWHWKGSQSVIVDLTGKRGKGRGYEQRRGRNY